MLGTVEARGASKVYGAVVALRNIDAKLDAGKVTALVGHNGAGKSTLLSLIATLTKPTTGTVLYDGKTARQLGATLRSLIGLATDHPLGYAELTGRENVILQARAHHLPDPKGRAAKVIAELGLEPLADRVMAGYSQGELRRVGLARALIHEPQLLLLDEPSAGLDAKGAELLAEQVRRRRSAGAVVVLATHDPWLGAQLSDRAIVMRRGRIVHDELAPSDEGGWRALLQMGVEESKMPSEEGGR